MGETLPHIHPYAEPVAAMAKALAAGDECAFRSALSAFDDVRDAEVVTGVRKVTVELQTALQRFEIDSRLIDLAQRQMPDARRRLEHVLALTDRAVHRTMDLVEQCGPLADDLVREARRLAPPRAAGVPGTAAPTLEAFARQVETVVLAMRERLSEVHQAQAYQDLSGQIIQNVMTLVDELERALGELARIADFGEGGARASDTLLRGRGPVVPGVEHGESLGDQRDVDALLSQLRA